MSPSLTRIWSSFVADTLDASKQASMDDEDSRVTMMYTAEIVLD